jgi:YbbR domain-containing protein
MRFFQNLLKQTPTFLTAFILAVAVWAIAVTSADPSVQKDYPSDIPIEIVGQAADLVIVNQPGEMVALSLRAPTSVWSTLIEEKVPVRAIIDLSGLGEGDHTIPIQIEIGVGPVELISYNPRSVEINLEKLATSQFDITPAQIGNLAIGYQAGEPELSDIKAIVSGASSYVSQVVDVVAEISMNGLTDNFSGTITLKAINKLGTEVKNVSISPEKITVSQPISQLGGFRNVVVKVVTDGQVAMGYRLTSIQVDPPTVTVFSTDPAAIEALPGYVETDPINLNGLKDDINQDVNLRLGNNITVVGDPTVNVKVDITTVENSQQMSNITVEAIGLGEGYTVDISPARADLIITGPLVALNSIVPSELKVQIDLTGREPGSYTFEPEVSLNYPDVRIENILPTTFTVTITKISPTPGS